VFTVEMLPAQRGDCLWLTYGEPDDPHHVLIDGGPSETIDSLVPELERRLKALPGRTSRVELLVITHIDADHIQGIVSLLSDHRRVKLFRDVWFNGFEHLRGDVLGAPDGERLTAALETQRRRWNKAFGGEAVVVPDSGGLPLVRLRGGLELTLLSPTPAALARLAPRWEEECEKAGLMPGKGAAVPRSWQRDDMLGFDVDLAAARPYRADRAEPNGSSIVFVATFQERSLLCGADAHAEILVSSLDRLGPGPHRFTAVKINHHGSRGNTSTKLLERIHSKHWLVSTDGAKFHHPHADTLARIVVTQDRPVFHLNYVTDDVADLISGAGDRYSVRLPRRTAGTYAEGLVVELA
jgi:beta-lactamase superfamily II metal-dependent hydrolase